MTFPDNLVQKIAMYNYIFDVRPKNQNIARDWRPDVEIWFQIPETKKDLWYENASQWLTDWSNKYPGSIDYVLENWVDVDFKVPLE